MSGGEDRIYMTYMYIENKGKLEIPGGLITQNAFLNN